MTSGGRLGDEGIEDPQIRPDGVDDPNIRTDEVGNPDIRPEGIDNPDIRPDQVDNPDIRPEGVDNPEIRPEGVDNPDIRPDHVDNPDLRSGVDNPEIAPQPMSGGIPILPIAIIGGLVVLAIAAFSLLGGGGATPPAGESTPGATTGAGTSSQPGASGGVVSPTLAPVGSGAASGSEEAVATVVLRGGFEDSYMELEGDDVSPTTTILAAVWVDARANASDGTGDLATVSIAGPVFSGTQTTSEAGITVSVSVSRADATGSELFFHLWTSKAGECQVTMAAGSAITGTFTCASLTSQDGVTVSVEGTYST
jgi:hypothetical protein